MREDEKDEIRATKISSCHNAHSNCRKCHTVSCGIAGQLTLDGKLDLLPSRVMAVRSNLPESTRAFSNGVPN